jgi:DNA-binding beta-propeller fold protein YncE
MNPAIPMIKTCLAPLLVAAAVATAVTARADAPLPYHVSARYPIGGKGSYDYIRYDPATHRLFASHQSRVEVINADSGLRVGSIGDLHGVHGIALAPDLGQGFISNGTDGTIAVFDLASLKVTRTIATAGSKPDAIEYDPVTHLVVVSNGHSNNATVINARTGAVVHLIALAGNPESIAFDGRGHVLINLESHNSVAQVDLATGAVLADWPVGPGEGPTGLAIDPIRRRLFVSCGGNEKLVVLDADSGRQVALLPVGDDSDGAAFALPSQRVFSSNRDGTLTVIQEDDADHFRVLGNVPTQFGAKTLAVDAGRDRIFLPVAKLTPGPDEDHPGPALPNTFQILVVSP